MAQGASAGGGPGRRDGAGRGGGDRGGRPCGPCLMQARPTCGMNSRTANTQQQGCMRVAEGAVPMAVPIGVMALLKTAGVNGKGLARPAPLLKFSRPLRRRGATAADTSRSAVVGCGCKEAHAARTTGCLCDRSWGRGVDRKDEHPTGAPQGQVQPWRGGCDRRCRWI